MRSIGGRAGDKSKSPCGAVSDPTWQNGRRHAECGEPTDASQHFVIEIRGSGEPEVVKAMKALIQHLGRIGQMQTGAAYLAQRGTARGAPSSFKRQPAA